MEDLSMRGLSSRHVELEESRRLGVEPGWYTTKISGTFVTGPHATHPEAARKILELNPPPIPPARRKL
ncbi:MAG: hypothetical protein WBA48_10800 [Xanthobacteraceae bacterium]